MPLHAELSTPHDLPSFDDLPLVKGPKGEHMPQGCAWGVFDEAGKKDVFGTLNLLTPDVVREAAAEVKDGVSVSLNWPLGAIAQPGFGRKGLQHEVISHANAKPVSGHAFDDEVSFNTQCSSQWDSLCHFHHQPTATAYNGTQPSREELLQTFGNEDKERKLPTLNHWHERGGLVGRGVLLDYKAWADANGKKFDLFDASKFSVDDLDAVAKAQGVTFRPGDILIIRSGFTEALASMDVDEQNQSLGTHRTCGVEGTEKAARWIWNNHFAAVAGDMIAFEHRPPINDGKETNDAGLVLHQYLLSLFGCPIGELWDLKALSEYCAKTKRYTFMLTSVPLNVPGLIGSPPNAVAIF